MWSRTRGGRGLHLLRRGNRRVLVRICCSPLNLSCLRADCVTCCTSGRYGLSRLISRCEERRSTPSVRVKVRTPRSKATNHAIIIRSARTISNSSKEFRPFMLIALPHDLSQFNSRGHRLDPQRPAGLNFSKILRYLFPGYFPERRFHHWRTLMKIPKHNQNDATKWETISLPHLQSTVQFVPSLTATS